MSPGKSALGIDLVDLTVTYNSGRGAFTAIADVGLRVEPGSFTCLVGPSGCGKSTLLGTIAGLIKPSAGNVLIDGRPVRGPFPGLGMVFQRDLLLPWRTVLNNVLLPIELMGKKRSAFVSRACALLASVGLEPFKESLPRELSGGMKQRVAICRALVHEPSLLLMDEPFGQVDALTRERLNEDVAALCEERSVTTVFVTHNIDEAVFLADKIVVMATQPGRVRTEFGVRLARPRQRSTLAADEYFSYVKRTRDALADADAIGLASG